MDLFVNHGVCKIDILRLNVENTYQRFKFGSAAKVHTHFYVK